MIPAREYLRSIEQPVLLGSLALALLVPLTLLGLRHLRARPWRELTCGEDGAAYSMAFVLTVPLYLFLVCLVIEATLLILVKLGTVYAAFAAARSAVVWLPAQPTGQAPDQAKLAAVGCLTPFASSSDLHTPLSSYAPHTHHYLAEAKKRLKGTTADTYFRNKFVYAWNATSIEIVRGGQRTGEPLRLRLTYQAPTYVPGVGQLFGKPSATNKFYQVTIVTEVSMADEAPLSKDGKLSIPYESR